MKRRKFVQSTLLAAPVIGGALSYKESNMEDLSKKKQQWYELRTYLFANEAQRQLTDTYLGLAYLPALNRAGVREAGVFAEWQPQGVGKMFVLIPFDSVEVLAALHERLAHDETYLGAGEAYLKAEPANPAYERIESSLLRAFAHMPRLEAPEKKERLFELRCYESPTESAGQKKIEMFNSAGEIDIFKHVGARPVFFGETIIGERRPNLTYMLCFDNMEAHDEHWKAFGNDPDWKRIKAIPAYSDAVLISKITRTFLTPMSYSQL